MRHDSFYMTSDKTHAVKAGLLPVAAITGTGVNDTSVTRSSVIMKTERLDSYGAISQIAA